MKQIEGITNQELVDILPHGSGIDCKWEFKWYKTCVHCFNSFHYMNENGYYDGYADFFITIPFDKPDDWNLHFTGYEAQYLNRKYQLRDYLEDTISIVLS